MAHARTSDESAQKESWATKTHARMGRAHLEGARISDEPKGRAIAALQGAKSLSMLKLGAICLLRWHQPADGGRDDRQPGRGT